MQSDISVSSVPIAASHNIYTLIKLMLLALRQGLSSPFNNHSNSYLGSPGITVVRLEGGFMYTNKAASFTATGFTPDSIHLT